MVYKYKDLYCVFNDDLKLKHDIDWFKVEQDYIKIGNYCGIYPDTALMLITLIDNTSLKKVIELGGGSSTLFIALSCDKNNIEFISYEEKDMYLQKTEQLLSLYDIDTSILKPYKDDIDFNDVDMLFLDCSDANRRRLLESEKLDDIPIIILDDFCSPGLSLAYSKFLRNGKHDRMFYVYNGVGRQDRHQLISWIPDMVPPLCDIISKNIPRIGVS